MEREWGSEESKKFIGTPAVSKTKLTITRPRRQPKNTSEAQLHRVFIQKSRKKALREHNTGLERQTLLVNNKSLARSLQKKRQEANEWKQKCIAHQEQIQELNEKLALSRDLRDRFQAAVDKEIQTRLGQIGKTVKESVVSATQQLSLAVDNLHTLQVLTKDWTPLEEKKPLQTDFRNRPPKFSLLTNNRGGEGNASSYPALKSRHSAPLLAGCLPPIAYTDHPSALETLREDEVEESLQNSEKRGRKSSVFHPSNFRIARRESTKCNQTNCENATSPTMRVAQLETSPSTTEGKDESTGSKSPEKTVLHESPPKEIAEAKNETDLKKETISGSLNTTFEAVAETEEKSRHPSVEEIKTKGPEEGEGPGKGHLKRRDTFVVKRPHFNASEEPVVSEKNSKPEKDKADPKATEIKRSLIPQLSPPVAKPHALTSAVTKGKESKGFKMPKALKALSGKTKPSTDSQNKPPTKAANKPRTTFTNLSKADSKTSSHPIIHSDKTVKATWKHQDSNFEQEENLAEAVPPPAKERILRTPIRNAAAPCQIFYENVELPEYRKQSGNSPPIKPMSIAERIKFYSPHEAEEVQKTRRRDQALMDCLSPEGNAPSKPLNSSSKENREEHRMYLTPAESPASGGEDNDQSDLDKDAGSSVDGGRRSTRGKTVNYKEPSLHRKMRRN